MIRFMMVCKSLCSVLGAEINLPKKEVFFQFKVVEHNTGSRDICVFLVGMSWSIV